MGIDGLPGPLYEPVQQCRPALAALKICHSSSSSWTSRTIDANPAGPACEGGSLCEPVLSHSWFSSIEVFGGRGSVHTIFGSISVRSAVLGSSWLVTSLPPTPAMCRQQPNEWVGANSFPRRATTRQQAAACLFLSCHLCKSHLQLQELTVTVLSQSFKA
jgi:hypothetical protein